jgi:hypothetical protein
MLKIEWYNVTTFALDEELSRSIFVMEKLNKEALGFPTESNN